MTCSNNVIGSNNVSGSKNISWLKIHELASGIHRADAASKKQMLKTDAGKLRMGILRKLGKMMGNYVTDCKTLMNVNINGLLRYRILIDCN